MKTDILSQYFSINISLLLIFMLFGCITNRKEKIEFVKNGKAQLLELRNLEETEDGYLKTTGEFLLKAKKAIYGDEIRVLARLSVGAQKGHIGITVGDNAFGISSEGLGDSDEKRIYLNGPSLGKGVLIGEMSKFIKADVPFDLTVTYKNETLTFAIDDQEIYSGPTIIPPSGRISMNEYGANFKVYDLICEGYFKPLEAFYTKEFLLDRGHKSVAIAAEAVKDDPNRPAYHFQPAANWNNDPNGMMFYKGYYHIFYQHNPYADRWDWMHWGHARSKDMVSWEHLPIALWPSVEKGENHCFSGSAFIRDDGTPILFYTSIGHENPEHWAAIPVDDELLDWEKHPANPLIVMEDHGVQVIDDWRDPFLFREKGDTYMVIGGHPAGAMGSIMMYKALNADLTDWEYIGSPFEGQEKNWECPNFFKIGDKYVLIYSPHSQVEYYTGTLDVDNVKFTKEYHGLIDNGAGLNYYAPNTLQKDDGRRILFGWIRGFKTGQGWQGAISLPRDLSIDDKGRLIQKPVSELTKLRDDLKSEKDIVLTNNSKKLDINNTQFEMVVNVAGQGTSNLGFRFNDEEGNPFEIMLTPENLILGEDQIKVEPVLDEKIKQVRFLFDRTIIEIFVNDGLLCATKVIYPDKNDLNFEIFNKGEKISITSIDIWSMKSIW